MTLYVIQYIGLEGIVIDKTSRANPGDLLKTYDPEAHDGQGTAIFTDKLDEAMTFEDITEAFRLIFKTPTKRPRRPDGQPNQPLRAFSLDIVSIDKVMRGK